ncbi:hypothetical protein A9Q99_16740 [Gammaproteobacteria bacterium 45_16_T64]|nr:hypothetical protein A9Q99_16740 [Gammaproteobacteria bacterium 45_16_T64]
MEQYEQIMSIEAVIPFVFGYTLHGVFAGIQIGFASVLLLSCGINLFSDKDIAWLRFVGITTNISLPSRRSIALFQLTASSLLLLPLFFETPFLLTVAIFIAIATFYFIYPRLPRHSSNPLSYFICYAAVLLSLLAAGMTGYEERSPLLSMVDIAQDITTFRPQEQAWQNKHDVDAPKVGDSAPNFSLPSSNGSSSYSLDEIRSDKLTVLFLGANSCPVFSAGMEDMNRLYSKYNEQVNFLGVYVSEPHAVDEWPLARTHMLKFITSSSAHPVAIDLKQQATFADRHWAASRFKNTLLNKNIPLLVDRMDNAINNTWVGRPARLYLISQSGEILYNPGKGPYSFNPSHLEPIIDQYLSKQHL